MMVKFKKNGKFMCGRTASVSISVFLYGVVLIYVCMHMYASVHVSVYVCV